MTEQAIITTNGAGALVPVAPGNLDRNPAAVYLAGLSEGSRRTMRDALNTIASLVLGVDLEAVWFDQGRDAAKHFYLRFPWAELEFQHVAAIRAKLAAQYKHTSANKMLSALRGTIHAAWKLGQMDSDTYMRARDFKRVKGSSEVAGRDITPGELSALVTACQNDDTAAGARDGAILAVAYCGLRRSEIVRLDVDDYDPEAGELLVHGKGDKERRVPLMGGTAAALCEWLAIRGDRPGPLFVQILAGGHVQHGKRLSAQAIYYILGERADQAGVKRLSPHDFRRTLAGDLLDAGVDLVTVKDLLGHEDVSTTQKYDRRPFRTRKQAAGKVHFPWRQTSF